MMKEEMNRIEEKKMRTMENQNFELKDYVKNGTLFWARRTWQIRSHKLVIIRAIASARPLRGCAKYETSRSRRIKSPFLCARSTKISEEMATSGRRKNCQLPQQRDVEEKGE